MTIKLWLSLLVFVMLAHTWVVQAETIITTVFNVFESQKTDRLLVLSGTDGRIYKIKKSEASEKLVKPMIGQIAKIDYSEVGEEAVINSIALARAGEVDQRVMDLNHFQYSELRKFAPTDLQSYEAAEELFATMLNDGDRRRSQCFKRAHMWAFDMWSKLGVSSQKIFIFYTKRYSILEDFEWWFHVAPMVLVKGQEMVLDGTFMEKPITLEEWKTNFIKSDKITCPVISSYSEYDRSELDKKNGLKVSDDTSQWNRLCYLMKTPMYNFRPQDIEDRDVYGAVRNNWVIEELQDARRAFKGYEKTYEGLDTGRETINH